MCCEACQGNLSRGRGVCMHRGMKRQSCSCQWRPCATEEVWSSPQISCVLSNSCSRWCKIHVAQSAWQLFESVWLCMEWSIFRISTLFAMNCSMPSVLSAALYEHHVHQYECICHMIAPLVKCMWCINHTQVIRCGWVLFYIFVPCTHAPPPLICLSCPLCAASSKNASQMYMCARALHVLFMDQRF